MCSITESALDPAMAVSRLSLSESSVCKKCPSREVAVVLRGKDVYCRECLLLGVQHKMRATLGKHKGKPVNYRVFHLKKLDSTLCLGDFLWYSEAVIGVKSSNRVGALTFRQEN